MAHYIYVCTTSHRPAVKHFNAYSSAVLAYVISSLLTLACTGEVIWMRHVLDKYHEAAKQQGVRIVHCCGFDSIPSDLGTCLVVDHLNRLGKYDLVTAFEINMSWLLHHLALKSSSEISIGQSGLPVGQAPSETLSLSASMKALPVPIVSQASQQVCILAFYRFEELTDAVS